jgi:THO complex subunit 1
VRRSGVAHGRDSVLSGGGGFDAKMASYGVQAVEEFGKLLDQMLNAALVIKPTSTIEPPLNKSDLAEFFERVPSIFPPTSSLESRKHVIDTAVRDAFNNLLVS